MEPMVLLALGIAIYTVYLTIKDLLSDLRAEGLLGASIPAGTLAFWWKSGLMAFSNTGRKPRRAWRAENPLILAPCRAELLYPRQHQYLESRLYRMSQR